MSSKTFEIIERQTVKHRDGTTTDWHKVRVPIGEVVRRFAIWTRMLPVGTPELPQGIAHELIGEQHGMMTYTYLRIKDSQSGRAVVLSKTRLGQYFGCQIETLDESGAIFWERQDKPNFWVLADVFSV